MKSTLLGLVIVLLCVGCALEGDNFLPTYTIVYHPNGGMGTMKKSAHVFGTEKKLNANKFTRQGFTFTGWSLTANGSVLYRNKASVKNLTKTDGETVALYAKWKLKLDMVAISAGTFQMGSPLDEPGRYNSEQPQHEVTLTSGFYMGKYPVTQAQYQAVTGTNPSNFSGNPAPGEVQENRPVEMVSWYDAVEFCNKLSKIEGLTPYYTIDKTTIDSNNNNTNTDDPFKWLVTVNSSANGYRLPTEAQWEYACRAKTKKAFNIPVGTDKKGSDTINNDTGWYADNSDSKTHEVGKKPANDFGLYDMHGNVWEWCWDWYGTYASGTQTDPTGVSSGTNRVDRGGSWGNAARNVRSAYRGSSTPSRQGNHIGFRLVRP